jgi:hypothetical protein
MTGNKKDMASLYRRTRHIKIPLLFKEDPPVS